ncbi:phage antirepressor KilAC domain-containing protein [Mycobacteroides abscessus subsp. bolletii]|uniref:phage antirepressor KilAC domain-containing protein n=1 Tax=Mycobacteroides abscessus TaxID=36809 RepID=UPI0019D25AC3|nr:phage antirepressor KilAC domain-containing protein [Mycobacteroides abscessus]QSM90489.1 phage antirepressor KilAC domain-containing protein [Mycobacteroides abscessus subsp. bolletii]
MSSDLTLASARADRDALADRTDALDKVGVLRMLPDDMNVTTEMVAEFYEVPTKTIQAVVMRNREELDDDGIRVVSRTEFLETFNMQVSNLDPKARSITLYPRRAVLRVGMLLRDSPVARKVRDHLLDSEHLPATREERFALALLDAKVMIDQRDAHIAELEPKARKFDNFLSADGDYDVNEAAKVLCRSGIETGEIKLGESLRAIRWTYKDHKGRPRAYQSAINAGYLTEKPNGEWIADDGRIHLRTPQVRVTPLGIDKLIEKLGGAA